MVNLPLVGAAAAFLLLIVIPAVLLLRTPGRDRQIMGRLAVMKGVVVTNAAPITSRYATLQRIGMAIAQSPLIGAKEEAKIVAQLGEAGIYSRDAMRIFIAVKAALGIGLTSLLWIALVATHFAPHSFIFRAVAIIAPALLGWRLPDMVINRIARRRRRRLAEGVPDALDLLIICVEAGLGLEQSLDRVSRDIAIANPIIGQALANAVAEMRVLPQMRDALDNLAKNTGLPAIKSVVTTLIQGIQYGTPLSASLRILSAEMRSKNLIALEERAARLPVLLMLPVIMFILPSLFLIIGGPVAIQVIHVMRGN
ncbi:MAG TPA: type II secretion system F family protein [Stellaceae bacterium]